MPYCPTHGFQQGKHCSQCGAPLSDSPPDTGDSVRVRSPEATAIVNIAQEAKTRYRPLEVECTRCGHFNALRSTFNCKGSCDRVNLCLRHFDKEYEVCVDCARELRGEAKTETEHHARLQADLADWRQRAEQAEAQVTELIQQGRQASKDLDRARSELRQAQERVQSLEQELAGHRQRAEQAEAQVAELTRQGQQVGMDLVQARADLSEAQERVRSLEQEFSTQRLLVGKTEADVAALSQAQERAGGLEQLQALNEQLRSDYAGLLAQFGQTQQERDSYKATLATATRDLGTAQSKLAASTDQLANKEVALNEAYLRAVKLQRELMDYQSMLAVMQSELAAPRRRAEQAEANATALTQRSPQAETNLAQRTAAMSQSHERVQALEKELASWRGRAEKAEGELATIEHRQRDTENATNLAQMAFAVQENQSNPSFEEELGGTVSSELLSILVCPEDRGPLVLSSDGKWLENPRNGYRYPIRKGIPVMLIEEGRKHMM